MHYLITGHTGFKGSWLTLFLKIQGHTVSGISLDPREISMFTQCKLNDLLLHDVRLDIRDSRKLKQSVSSINPEIIIHLAAQPLVRESYKSPVETFEINVLGSLNLLEATRQLQNLKATLIITTDKVYKSVEKLIGYVETDPLGGHDPYSASKAAADLATQSWIKSFGSTPASIARAGNVIGGGDWGVDRLIPDLVNAYTSNSTPIIRNPQAVRPWQHVLDCINGYQVLVERMLKDKISGEWNFGPQIDTPFTVENIVDRFAKLWGVKDGNSFKLDSQETPTETNLLLLDSSKARNNLNWEEKLSLEQSLRWTVDWYKTENKRQLSEVQVKEFLEL